MEDAWKLLDPHDPVTTSDSNRPFKKGIILHRAVCITIHVHCKAQLFHMLLYAYTVVILACTGVLSGMY